MLYTQNSKDKIYLEKKPPNQEVDLTSSKKDSFQRPQELDQETYGHANNQQKEDEQPLS